MKAQEIFQTIPNDLLALIASGKLNAQELATQELAKRGFNAKGKFVGFSK